MIFRLGDKRAINPQEVYCALAQRFMTQRYMTQRFMAQRASPELSRRGFVSAAALAVGFAVWGGPTPVRAQQPPQSGVLFQNVRIFDGTSSDLKSSSNVLVVGNIIKTISPAPIADPAGMTVTRIEGGGRTLMPGLIDAHWHAMMIRANPAQAINGDVGYNNIAAADEAADTLMRGFTTVRDVGGPAFGLKQAIDEGIAKGPRIYPSGAVITVTSGHGDFRQLSELPRTIGGMMSRMEQIGGSMLADSPDEVRLRVREQLMQGASQIKLTAGGGVSSPFSPIDVTTFTETELHAAVEAAENWGTYVTVHAFTSAAIRRSIAAGVKCIEHGFLMDEATAKMMADKGIWLSTQPLPEEMRDGFPPGSVQRAKADKVWPGIARTYELAKKYKIKTAWGTDVLFSRALAQHQGAILASLVRWYTPAEALTMATSVNAELLTLSGERNPYPGKLGVVEQGALADLLLVDGNPLENIQLIADPAKNFLVIMKDGKIFKNSLARPN
jgi:imidazolonepropionase-like amidohydrolase